MEKKKGAWTRKFALDASLFKIGSSRYLSNILYTTKKDARVTIVVKFIAKYVFLER